MATVFDVAKYILEKQGPLPALKLQKLVYYSQAWSLVWDGKPLFGEEIQAWRGGPVVPALYNARKGMIQISAGDLHQGDPSALTADQIETIDAVLDFYGKMAPWQLSNLTHQEDPWLKARERVGAGPGDSSNEKILEYDMLEYYANV